MPASLSAERLKGIRRRVEQVSHYANPGPTLPELKDLLEAYDWVEKALAVELASYKSCVEALQNEINAKYAAEAQRDRLREAVVRAWEHDGDDPDVMIADALAEEK